MHLLVDDILQHVLRLFHYSPIVGVVILILVVRDM